ncbi:MAG: hypothetical protein EBX47_08995 [Synechococcaceae bacterium WB8_1B_057]|nr:hypothetical protein [Synechococcaceae bacterium WB6_3A_227]NDG79549.1 hypothetical protein [Synechococcaceae bacterium WB8_1B_057]
MFSLESQKLALNGQTNPKTLTALLSIITGAFFVLLGVLASEQMRLDKCRAESKLPQSAWATGVSLCSHGILVRSSTQNH